VSCSLVKFLRLLDAYDLVLELSGRATEASSVRDVEMHISSP